MDLTWIALAASLLMGLGAVCIFILAVKRDYFHNLEDAKFQVFWSDLEELVDHHQEPKENIRGSQNHRSETRGG